MHMFKGVCRYFSFFLALGVSVVFSHTSFAAKVTPSQVYQVTEDILLQLKRMHDSNLTIPDLTKLHLDLPPRLPRHVIQQALNVRLKIQLLKRVNGMKLSEITAPPVKEVTPGDVMNVATVILDELKTFDKAYNLTPFKKSAKFVDGKTPTDVYKNLLRAQAMIVQLGIPGTVPNNVYNNAVSVSEEIKRVSAAVNKTVLVDAPSPSVGKKPSDAYTLAYYALKGIQALSKKPEYAIPKGVQVPKRIKSGIKPADVQQLLLFCLAELSSMKVKVGATEPLVLPKPTAGQTPSTVFDQLGLVNRQIQSMQW
ncbi:hypothetical protein [Terasakiella sp. SH-1]|uniref:hypothetical protein n=1 Tax=Terasakiella sp. SH-1 TaxID=2560057 RepID=UPI001431E2D0|nr:hypothetical protein [Terasakiella sp. SH-1]